MDNPIQTPQNSQPSNSLSRRSRDLVETKAGSFLTNKLFLIAVSLLILFAIIYSGIYLSLDAKVNQVTKSKPAPTTLNINQGAMGKIEIAPTCAGPERPPGMPQEICSKPFQGTVLVKKKDSKKEITRFTTNSKGEFTIELSVGEYILEPITTAGLPGIPKQFDLVVTANKVTQVTISIDTGIR